MYAAKTVNKEISKQHLSGYQSENFQKVVGKADKITGFLLIYPTCCLHVLEGDTTSLMAILRSLQADPSSLESICILSFTEDVTYRFFPSWMAGFINASNLGPYEPKNTKNLLSEISNLNINVLKWGKKLSEMDKIQQAQALDSVRSSTEEFLPDDPAAIFAFILADETPKLEEFLEIYDRPPKDIIFDNDILKLRANTCTKLHATQCSVAKEEGLDGVYAEVRCSERGTTLEEGACLISIEAERRRKKFNEGLKDKELKRGMLVLRYDNRFDNRKDKKFLSRWEGLFQKKYSNGSYQLQEINGRLHKTRVNGWRLKPYFQRFDSDLWFELPPETEEEEDNGFSSIQHYEEPKIGLEA
ncbi:hypothetical protein L7F22_060095 [Adiantum nelumboides]|nr:hypothetical protein [Adiantum nelumboides]